MGILIYPNTNYKSMAELTEQERFEKEYFQQQEFNRLERYHIRQGYKQDPMYQIYTKAYNQRYEK